MSADNGIYIAEFPDGFRVIHAQAIENLYFYEEGSKEWHDTIDGYFKESKVLKTEKEARKTAQEMNKKITDEYLFTEYGICSIGFFNHKF